MGNIITLTEFYYFIIHIFYLASKNILIHQNKFRELTSYNTSITILNGEKNNLFQIQTVNSLRTFSIVDSIDSENNINVLNNFK